MYNVRFILSFLSNFFLKYIYNRFYNLFYSATDLGIKISVNFGKNITPSTNKSFYFLILVLSLLLL